ncbi:hypothetical protein Snoj_14560 [Streptomyces nojiriensis]|uniref:Uncharacterized protein n=1 Tax=Streptomyces nojiriensis TaxID=66374 RepID=A0ABQ3SHB6_9ACTN|nr:hypothetical protein Snoj_14560 [Streptomyces nojiriensis]
MANDKLLMDLRRNDGTVPPRSKGREGVAGQEGPHMLCGAHPHSRGVTGR